MSGDIKLDRGLEREIDLLKLEYQTLSTRYENIYKAIWQNFSFVSIVAAGILTFASNALQPVVAVFFAGIPFVFWFIGQFVPLDRYGQDAREDLGRIEAKLNALVPGAQMSAYTKFHKKAHEMSLFERLCERRYRVVQAMWAFFWFGLILWLVSIGFAASKPDWFVKPPSQIQSKP